MVDYINVIVALMAGIIYTIVAIILDISVVTWSYNMIVVILIFLVLGSLYKRYLIKNIFNDKMLESEKLNIEDDELEENNSKDDAINIDEDELDENENFFESLGDE